MIYRCIKTSPNGNIHEGSKFPDFSSQVRYAREYGVLEEYFEAESVMARLEADPGLGDLKPSTIKALRKVTRRTMGIEL